MPHCNSLLTCLENSSGTQATGLSAFLFRDTLNKQSLLVVLLAYFAGRILLLARLNTILICLAKNTCDYRLLTEPLYAIKINEH